MKVIERLTLAGTGLVLFAACGGSSSGGGSGFAIVEASNGFGRLLPYEIPVLGSNGTPSAQVIEIRSLADLAANLRDNNPIRPPSEWPVAGILPNGAEGNHFIYVRFNRELDIDSILDPATSAAANNNLTGSIKLVSVDPITRATTDLSGRAFVGGFTYGPTLDPEAPGNFKLERWVGPGSPDLVALDVAGTQPGLGFPGTEGGFAGADVLVDSHTFVFVIDNDRNLATHETFPAGSQIQMRITDAVRSQAGRALEDVGLASSTVGPDTTSPIVTTFIPGDLDEDVDPETNIELTFSEPVQLLTVGKLEDGKPPAISAAVQIVFGPSAGRVEVPFSLRPFSVYDLSRVELVPAYNFPGSGPDTGGTCGAFGAVTVQVNAAQYTDLCGLNNSDNGAVVFTTREGPGVVNAPVVPDAIYLGRAGALPGLSVIDLNGFGGSTGNPTYDGSEAIKKGNSNFPNNPNVQVQGAQLIPPLSPGQCTYDGGSEGVFTLTKDSSLGTLLARRPLLESVADIAVGHSLDTSFNSSAPFGCQAGGGNICANNGLKVISLTSGGPNTLAPSTTSTLPTKTVRGGENLVSFSPHPNPPQLVFPPICLAPLINAQEPTSAYSAAPPAPVGAPPTGPGLGLPNLLVPGPNAQGNPRLGIPPRNLLSSVQHTYFDGPSAPQTSVLSCLYFATRQQIGHFLYVIDRVAGEVVVFNSNRFTVIDRIRLPDPTSLAMSPNLDLLAVTNEGADQVSFIDIDPGSSSFHQVVRSVSVGAGPTGIAWETGNEDIFVCNQGEGTVSILSAFNLRTRKVIRNQITRPIDVALTPRQLGFGFQRGVYFGYILNQDGKLAFFESGPDGANGWGFDDTVGSLPFTFTQPKAIQPDVTRLNSAVWVAHENRILPSGEVDPSPGGALTQVGISSATTGIVILGGAVANPQIRNIQFGVFSSLGEGTNGLSGTPVDMAFDNMVNVTALTNYASQFSAGQAVGVNGKALVRANGGGVQPVSFPKFMFLAVPNPGVVDVFELGSGTLQRFDTDVFEDGVQSIPAPDVTVVADYLRQ